MVTAGDGLVGRVPSEEAVTTALGTARFAGGPLDGRESPLPGSGVVDGHVITHVYLHGGPKIETRYRLMATEHGTWEYRVISED